MEVVVVFRIPPAVAEAAEHGEDRDRVDAARERDDVFPIGRKEVILGLCGERRPHLGSFLPVAGHPEGKLTLTLQVGGFDVEAAHHNHVAAELLKSVVTELVY